MITELMITELSLLQRALQRSIVSGVADARIDAEGDDAARRLGIYATAYRLRLQDALGHNFPMLQLLLGPQRFGEFASRYLDAHPSTHVSVRAFGAHLSEWLQAECPREPWIAEFAGMESALADAFDAPDQIPLTVEALAAVEADCWPHLRFTFAAHVRRLTLLTNAAHLYGQVTRDESPSTGCNSDRPSEWLIWREALTARYRSIEEIEATAFDALQRGSTFAQMCELLFESYEVESVPVQAAALLKRWVTDALIVHVDIAD